jgi:hypothetical protein
VQQDIQKWEITNNKKTITDMETFIRKDDYRHSFVRICYKITADRQLICSWERVSINRKVRAKNYEHLMIIFGARKKRLAEILGSADNVRRLPVHIHYQIRDEGSV